MEVTVAGAKTCCPATLHSLNPQPFFSIAHQCLLLKVVLKSYEEDPSEHMLSADNGLTAIYSVCWTLSPYIPIFQNKISGISFDFLVLNEIGYLSVFVSMLLQYKYMDGITLFDIMYSINGLSLNTFNIYKKIYRSHRLLTKELPHHIPSQTSKSTTLSFYYQKLVNLTLGSILISIFLLLFRFVDIVQITNFLSLVKLVMSFVKNFPQIKQNSKQDMSRNFPILQTLLDLVGCVALIAYTCMVSFNFTKITMCLVTLFFQCVYIYQYLLSKSKL